MSISKRQIDAKWILTESQVAQRLDISLNRLREMARLGDGPSFTEVKGKRLYNEVDLHAFEVLLQI